jgi:hypothetical protein
MPSAHVLFRLKGETEIMPLPPFAARRRGFKDEITIVRGLRKNALEDRAGLRNVRQRVARIARTP